VFGGDRFILGTAVNMGRFSGDLEQTLLVTGAHLVGVATISFALSGDADQPDKSRTWPYVRHLVSTGRWLTALSRYEQRATTWLLSALLNAAIVGHIEGPRIVRRTTALLSRRVSAAPPVKARVA
jgi:hypothetical protein